MFDVKCFVLIAIVVCHPSVSADDVPPEQLLMENLFKNYSSLARPKMDPNEPLNITVAMMIESLSEINDKDGTITISGWVDMNWKDEGMCWDPNDYGNVSFFIAPADKFWRPDLASETTIGERFFSPKDQVMAVTSDCNVDFAPGGRSTHSCDLDVTLFPFDSQVCNFVISTWFSGASFIRLQALNLSYDKTEENEVWKIIKTESSQLTEGSTAYGQVTFSLYIQRKPLYYVLYVVSPLVVLAILNLMVFRLPPNSGEKISLSITVLLSFSIWLLMLNDLTPRSSVSIPILGIFITVLMFLSAISTILTVHVMRIHHRDEHRPVTPWARRLVRLFARWNKCNKVKDVDDVGDKSFVSWQSVAEAMDSLSFATIAAMTAVMVATCTFSILALRYK